MVRISLFTFIIFSSFAVIGLYLPLYFQFKGFSNGQIGLIMGLGALVSIFSQPFWGFMSDRFKTIKKILTTVILCAIVVSVPLFSSDKLSFVILFIMLFMFFFSSSGPLTESLIVKFANEHNRNYGSVRLWGEVGVGVAALWLGFTLQQLGMGVLGWLFVATMGCSLIAMTWIPDATAHSTPVTKQSLVRLLTNRPFLLFIGIQLMMGIPHRMNDTFLPIYLKELGGSESDVGFAMLIATFSAVPTMALMGVLLKKYNELLLISIATFFYVVRWSLYGIFSDPLIIMLLQAMHMLTFPIVFVASIQFVYKFVPRELMSTGQTLYLTITFGLGSVIGSFAGGWVMDHFQSNTLYFSGAVLSFIGLIAMLTCYPYFNRQKEASW